MAPMPARRLAGPGIIALGVVLTLARAPKAADGSSSPRAVVDKYCLSCHSTADNAPATLVALYGSQNGFGWKLGDVVDWRLPVIESA